MKPGTRCECREGREPFHACGLALGQGDKQCRRPAVRLVTVLEGKSLDGTPMFGKRVLCAACAEYHEKEARHA